MKRNYPSGAEKKRKAKEIESQISKHPKITNFFLDKVNDSPKTSDQPIEDNVEINFAQKSQDSQVEEFNTTNSQILKTNEASTTGKYDY